MHRCKKNPWYRWGLRCYLTSGIHWGTRRFPKEKEQHQSLFIFSWCVLSHLVDVTALVHFWLFEQTNKQTNKGIMTPSNVYWKEVYLSHSHGGCNSKVEQFYLFQLWWDPLWLCHMGVASLWECVWVRDCMAIQRGVQGPLILFVSFVLFFVVGAT